MITVFPNSVHCSNVFTTTNPVTQTAEVAVKKALINPTFSPLLLAMGKLSKKLPNKITAKNPNTKI